MSTAEMKYPRFIRCRFKPPLRVKGRCCGLWSLSAAIAVAFALLFPSPGVSDADVVEPEGYRMDDYRSPVPDTLRGAKVIDAIELNEMIEADPEGVALIDVLPLHPKPPDFPPDRLWRPPTRYNIPGSIWLPNVGYGTISPQYKSYLIENIELVNDRENPKQLVFYCAADCWMSWNVAKRALELGIGDDNIYWFPGGTDEWEMMGYELGPSKPIELPVEPNKE